MITDKINLTFFKKNNKKKAYENREKLLKIDEQNFQREFYKKAILSYPPRSVTIAISSPCTNKCIFCAYHSDDAKNGNSNVYNLHYKIPIDKFKKMIDMCYEGRVPHIHICATGEPFFHKDILEMMDYSIKVYGKTSIQTNFSKTLFLKKNYLDEIIKRKNYISYITTDILSGKPEEHEYMKQGSKYEDVMSSLEYINKRSNIHFEIHYIITKFNYKHINQLIYDLHRRKINCHIAIVNLHPHGFNEVTSIDYVYKSTDLEITETLKKAQKLASEKGINVTVPKPFDKGSGICGSFWTRFQIWPVKGINHEKYAENVIVGGCNAVVKGKLNTLGYFFDYKNIMDLWNDKYFVRIRENLTSGVYPDNECKFCQSYKGEQ